MESFLKSAWDVVSGGLKDDRSLPGRIYGWLVSALALLAFVPDPSQPGKPTAGIRTISSFLGLPVTDYINAVEAWTAVPARAETLSQILLWSGVVLAVIHGVADVRHIADSEEALHDANRDRGVRLYRDYLRFNSARTLRTSTSIALFWALIMQVGGNPWTPGWWLLAYSLGLAVTYALSDLNSDEPAGSKWSYLPRFAGLWVSSAAVMVAAATLALPLGLLGYLTVGHITSEPDKEKGSQQPHSASRSAGLPTSSEAFHPLAAPPNSLPSNGDAVRAERRNDSRG